MFLAQIAWAPSVPLLIDFVVEWDVPEKVVVVRLVSKRPDRDSGEPIDISAGGAYLHCPGSPARCLERVIECLERVYLHELHESFLFGGARILDPHAAPTQIPLSSGSNLQPTSQRKGKALSEKLKSRPGKRHARNREATAAPARRQRARFQEKRP